MTDTQTETKSNPTLESLVRQLRSTPTPHDLHTLASSPRVVNLRSTFTDEELDELADVYDEHYDKVRGRYKINELDKIPLRVRTYEPVHNNTNGTTYIVLTGYRKDTDEPMSVRTSARGIMQWFQNAIWIVEDDGNKYVDVVFIKIPGVPPYNPHPHWTVRRLLAAQHDNPFERNEDSE